MQIHGVSLDSFRSVVRVVNLNYGGNLAVAPDAHSTTGSRAIESCTARLVTLDPRNHGSRMTAGGRRGCYACWHAYRDVLRTLFARYPNARVTTRMVIYRGLAGFHDLYPPTSVTNIGSTVTPAFMPDLCECSHEGMPREFLRLRRPEGTFAPFLVRASSEPVRKSIPEIPNILWPVTVSVDEVAVRDHATELAAFQQRYGQPRWDELIWSERSGGKSIVI